jgi:hypothetical protein
MPQMAVGVDELRYRSLGRRIYQKISEMKAENSIKLNSVLYFPGFLTELQFFGEGGGAHSFKQT